MPRPQPSSTAENQRAWFPSTCGWEGFSGKADVVADRVTCHEQFFKMRYSVKPSLATIYGKGRNVARSVLLRGPRRRAGLPSGTLKRAKQSKGCGAELRGSDDTTSSCSPGRQRNPNRSAHEFVLRGDLDASVSDQLADPARNAAARQNHCDGAHTHTRIGARPPTPRCLTEPGPIAGGRLACLRSRSSSPSCPS